MAVPVAMVRVVTTSTRPRSSDDVEPDVLESLLEDAEAVGDDDTDLETAIVGAAEEGDE